MPRLPEGQAYAGRTADTVPVQFSIDREALELARMRTVGPKALWRYVSRLVYEDIARREERQRVMQREGLAE